ncbi:hypothetical protein CANMA_005429 [Candida margitis]|uniref:uncharacterized protein n=1 Tax=Candida margitis TaxID=1775924 RepID=UPI0022268A3C|nr:uncharacterized protein CANMA_005429 [Candida margitis]KAI5949849.1 hypothetical protein CANMA_005429 [Candida margitis]
MLMDLPLEIQMKLLYMVPHSNLKYVNSHYYTLYNDLFYHKIVAVFGEDTINVIIKILPWLKPYIKSLDSFRYVNRMIIAKRLKLVDNLNKEDDDHHDHHHAKVTNEGTSSFRALTTHPDHVESIKQDFGNEIVIKEEEDRQEEVTPSQSSLASSYTTNNPLNVQYVKDSWKYIYSILKNKRLYAEYSDYQIDEPRNYVYNHFVEINRTYLLSYSKDVWLAPGQYNLNIGLAVKHGHGLGTTKFEVKYRIDDDDDDDEGEEEMEAEVAEVEMEEAEAEAEAEAEEAEEAETVTETVTNRNGNANGDATRNNIVNAHGLFRPNGSIIGGGVDRSVNGSMNETVDATTQLPNNHTNNAQAANNNNNNNNTIVKSFYPPTNINEILPKNQFCLLRVAQFTIPPKGSQQQHHQPKRNKLRKVSIKMEEIGLYLKSGFRIYFIDISQPSMLYDEYDLLYYSINETDYKYFINILLKNLYKALDYVQNGGMGGDGCDASTVKFGINGLYGERAGGGGAAKYGSGDPYDLWDKFDKSFLKEYNEEIVNDSNSASIIKGKGTSEGEGEGGSGVSSNGNGGYSLHKRVSSAHLFRNSISSVSAASSYASLNSLHGGGYGIPFKYDLKKLTNYANFYFTNIVNTKRYYKFSTIYQQRQFINRFGDYDLDWKEQLYVKEKLKGQHEKQQQHGKHGKHGKQGEQKVVSSNSVKVVGHYENDKQGGINGNDNDKSNGNSGDTTTRLEFRSRCTYDKLGLKWKIPIVGEL